MLVKKNCPAEFRARNTHVHVTERKIFDEIDLSLVH